MTERQFNRLVNEAEWNYHFGSNHDMSPYHSDNRYQMLGRETGHFGSGTYFSTYKEVNHLKSFHDEETRRRNGYVTGNDDPEEDINHDHRFIQIKDHIYRVDFDLYKNLYRVRSKRQGDVLFTMLKNVNAMFNNIAHLGGFKPQEAHYDNARYYQIIERNARGLGLRCPSYYELTRMAQRHAMDKDAPQSFSTVFMEWNGYNGVNVSGVEYYDNTKHGSVIYDLSKVDGDMEEVSPSNLYTPTMNTSYDNTIVSDGFDDVGYKSLTRSGVITPDELNAMPLNGALRVLKNCMDNGEVLDAYKISSLGKELARRYLRLLYVKRPKNRWGDDEIASAIGSHADWFAEAIEEAKAYYWVNYNSKGLDVFCELLYVFDRKLPWGLSDEDESRMRREYADNLLAHLERDLTNYEKEELGEFLNAYGNDLNESVNSVLKASNSGYVDLKSAVKNFNKWFKGSKVVEANGDPLLCYHGTTNGGFYTFNTIEGVDKKTKWQLLFGSHFTNDKEQGELYAKGKRLMTVFLSIKNPLDVTKNGEHSVCMRYTDGTEGYDMHPELIDKIDSILPPRLVKKYKFKDSHCEGYVLWNVLNDMTPFKARKLVEALGFDGIKYDARYQMGPMIRGYANERTDVSWIALYPTQIKSATENNGSFSPTDGDIRS